MGRIAGLAAVASTLSGASALTTPMSAHAVRTTMPAVSDADSMASSSCIAGRSSRRGFLASLAGAAALGTMPAPSFASYALYQSSYDTITERKATGDWQKSIGSDTQTLADIQADIAKKRPSSKPKKAPQYCAGQMASVSPMYENMCANIGVSKADQSNSMADSFGNMNVGVSTGLSGAEKARAEAKMALVREAADNARLRREVGGR